ncbi:MAG: hypothetical protein ACJ8AG_31485 [Ktedonobacteraceae bacterium]
MDHGLSSQSVIRGSAIPADLQVNLFRPFVAGSHSLGLGLGLYLAHNIATAHGGALVANSLHNEVHFIFSIPIEKDDVPEDDEPFGSSL